MKIQIIHQELWEKRGGMVIPGMLPVYESNLKNPVLYFWDGEHAVRCPHKRVFGKQCEFFHIVKIKSDVNDLDQYYEEMNSNLLTQVKNTIWRLAEEADKGRIVVGDEENYIRIVHFVKLYMAVSSIQDGWYCFRHSAFTAEVFGRSDVKDSDRFVSDNEWQKYVI